MRKHMVIDLSNNTLSTIVDTEGTGQQSLIENCPKRNTVNIVSANSSRNLFERTEQNETGNSEWQNNIKTLEEYNKCREAFFDMLEPFLVVSDGVSEL